MDTWYFMINLVLDLYIFILEINLKITKCC